jgi:hypothetical protein
MGSNGEYHKACLGEEGIILTGQASSLCKRFHSAEAVSPDRLHVSTPVSLPGNLGYMRKLGPGGRAQQHLESDFGTQIALPRV